MKAFQREHKLVFSWLCLSVFVGNFLENRQGLEIAHTTCLQLLIEMEKKKDILKNVTNPGAPLFSHCTTSWLYKCIQEDQNPVKVLNGSFFQPWRGNFNLKLPFSRLPSVGQHNQQNPNLRALVPLVTQSFGDLQSENHFKTSDGTLLFCLQLHLCTSLSLSFN